MMPPIGSHVCRMSIKDDLHAYKGSIINEMYMFTADENYITARWCYDNGLMTDFFWNSVHALEKYMKAVLLFNGMGVGRFSHGLAALWDELLKLAGPLLPTDLARPANLDIDYWHDMTAREFIEALDRNGNADNRYLTFGYVQRHWYLHMVDSLVWAVRRLALPLDAPILNRRDVPTAPTHRDVLIRQPDYTSLTSLPVDKLITGPDSDARRALLNNNCAFAPDDFQHEPKRSRTSGRNPVLLRRILEPLRSDIRENARHGYRLAVWLLSSTKQSGPVRKEILTAMEAARAAHPGIDAP
jgi:hypothetical protein